MKKFILGLVLAFIGTISMFAQVVDNGSAKDNWYVGGGVGTQIWDNSNSWNVFNPVEDQQLNINAFGGKYFTPYLGAELDATALFNTGAEKKFIDGHLVSLNGVANLSNIVCGYKGSPRKFEVEAIVGAGWYHAYVSGPDYDHAAVRGALRGNFKVSKNLRVYVMPEYVSLPSVNSNFNMRPHGVNVYAGVKWNIPSKRGSFPVCALYNAAEVEALNARITDLQAELAKTPEAVKVIEYVAKPIVENVNNSYTVLFEKSSSVVGDLTAVAADINKTTAPVTIIGGASPEGSEDFNRNLALARAEAVKTALVNAGVDASRITVTNDYNAQRRATIVIE